MAKSGNTGLSIGQHPHFQFHSGRSADDPLPHIGASRRCAAQDYSFSSITGNPDNSRACGDKS